MAAPDSHLSMNKIRRKPVSVRRRKDSDDEARRPIPPPKDGSAVSYRPERPAKRLFSNRDSAQISDVSDESSDDGYTDDAQSDASHDDKRHRSGEWPSIPTSSASVGDSRMWGARTSSLPRGVRGGRPGLPRSPSKFIEGSMNDRISLKPSHEYLGIFDSMDVDGADIGKIEVPTDSKKSQSGSTTSAASAKTDKAKHARSSSIFRFGKSLASAFNPSNWKTSTKYPEDSSSPDHQRKVEKEREAKAAEIERIYQEMKAGGYFEKHTTHLGPPKRGPNEVKHDSGAFVNRMSVDTGSVATPRKSNGQSFDLSPLAPQSQHGHHLQTLSPGTDGETSGLKVNLKRLSKMSTTSQVSLDGIGPSPIPAPSPIPMDPDQNILQQVRRVPSRKDIQRQQKLAKKVSDLEGKLDIARKQLSDALNEPMPVIAPGAKFAVNGRYAFTPGALATLPSERLLNTYVGPRPQDMGGFGGPAGHRVSQIGKALSTDEELQAAVAAGAMDLNDKPKPTAIDEESETTPAKTGSPDTERRSSTKRKNTRLGQSDTGFHAEAPEDSDTNDAIGTPNSPSPKKRCIIRPRKSEFRKTVEKYSPLKSSPLRSSPLVDVAGNSSGKHGKPSPRPDSKQLSLPENVRPENNKSPTPTPRGLAFKNMMDEKKGLRSTPPSSYRRSLQLRKSKSSFNWDDDVF